MSIGQTISSCCLTQFRVVEAWQDANHFLKCGRGARSCSEPHPLTDKASSTLLNQERRLAVSLVPTPRAPPGSGDETSLLYPSFFWLKISTPITGNVWSMVSALIILLTGSILRRRKHFHFGGGPNVKSFLRLWVGFLKSLNPLSYTSIREKVLHSSTSTTRATTSFHLLFLYSNLQFPLYSLISRSMVRSPILCTTY